MSPAEVAARLAAQGPVRTVEPTKSQRKILERFPASAPRGSWPAEEFAAGLRRDGRTVDVVMDLASDSYLVVEAA